MVFSNHRNIVVVALYYLLGLCTSGKVDGFLNHFRPTHTDPLTADFKWATRADFRSTSRRGAIPNVGVTPSSKKSSSVSPALREHTQPLDDEETIDWTKYWYPIFPLNYLNDDDDMATKAISMTVLNQPLVIWRSSCRNKTISTRSGNADHTYSVFANVCPHRKAPLSLGKIIHNSDDEGSINLACRYHGWEFDKLGSCTKIPMTDTGSTSTASRAFATTLYPTQQLDGLLWVYMDPNDPNPPTLPAPIGLKSKPGNNSNIESDNQQYAFSLNVFPVSFRSMIENSFDPSHAPFTHESLDPTKKSFLTYLSQNAIPMQDYRLAKDEHTGEPLFSRTGFTVQHTPYQITAVARDGGASQDQPITTRKFIAPFTNVAQLPFFNTTLHFVPSRAGETLVFGGGAVSTSRMFSPMWRKKQNLLTYLIPNKIQTIVHEFLHFYFSNLADGSFRFYNQDVQIMQGQDQIKMMFMSQNNKRHKSSFWNDMYPFKSDKGVQYFQQWMDRFGGRPSFTMPDATTISTSSSSRPYIPSAWDRHAKYCPQCKRTLSRLSKVRVIADKVSKMSLAASIVAGLGLGTTVIKALTTNRLPILPWTLMLLLASVASHFVSMQCGQLLERVFVSPQSVSDYQLMDIYSRK